VLYQFSAAMFLEAFRVVNLDNGAVSWSADYPINLASGNLVAYPRIFYPVVAQGPLVVVDATDSEFLLADFTPYLHGP
jgi:hypothetical protein